jgi:hypothetical protein
MNRTQRRAAKKDLAAAEREEKRSTKMAQEMKSMETKLQIQHGHTEDKVFIGFTRMVDRVYLTPDEARAMSKCVLESLVLLEKHIASQGNWRPSR